MARHNDTGKRGEQLAALFLMQAGFAILHQNWRHGRDELDIIAIKQQTLHFIEVKTRSTVRFGWPEASVTVKKLLRLLRAGDAFLRVYGYTKDVQYDVLSVLLLPRQPPKFLLIEDVYV